MPAERTYCLQLALIAFLWCLWDVVAVVQIRAVAGNDPLVAAAISLGTPFLGFQSTHWWVEQKTVWRRLGLTAAGAIGAAAGTAAVMLAWGAS
jgi:hypothetical protein